MGSTNENIGTLRMNVVIQRMRIGIVIYHWRSINVSVIQDACFHKIHHNTIFCNIIIPSGKDLINNKNTAKINSVGKSVWPQKNNSL